MGLGTRDLASGRCRAALEGALATGIPAGRKQKYNLEKDGYPVHAYLGTQNIEVLGIVKPIQSVVFGTSERVRGPSKYIFPGTPINSDLGAFMIEKGFEVQYAITYKKTYYNYNCD